MGDWTFVPSATTQTLHAFVVNGGTCLTHSSVDGDATILHTFEYVLEKGVTLHSRVRIVYMERRYA